MRSETAFGLGFGVGVLVLLPALPHILVAILGSIVIGLALYHEWVMSEKK